LKLGLFLDGVVFGEAAASIREAWGEREVTGMPNPGLLQFDLANHRESVWITVGHVEGQHYVMRNSEGQEARISIPELLTAARRAGVVVIPIGCKTAGSSAPIGFIKEIGTDSVARFLRALPRHDVSVGDILAGLGEIGQVRVRLRDVLDQFEVEVVDQGFVAPYGFAEQQITHFKISYDAFGGVNSLAASQFEESVLDDADAHRPLGQRRWFLAIVGSPFLYIGCWLLFTFACSLWRCKMITNTYGNADEGLVELLGVPWTLTVIAGKVLGFIAIFALGIFVLASFPPLIFVVMFIGLCMKFAEKHKEE